MKYYNVCSSPKIWDFHRVWIPISLLRGVNHSSSDSGSTAWRPMSCRSPEVSAEIQQIAVTWTWYAASWANGGNALGCGHSIWISMDQYIWIRKKCSDCIRCSKNHQKPKYEGGCNLLLVLGIFETESSSLSKPISPGFITPKLSTCRWDWLSYSHVFS